MTFDLCRVVGPLDLTVYGNAEMVIQQATHGRSPPSIDRAMVGYRLPVLRTSAGAPISPSAAGPSGG